MARHLGEEENGVLREETRHDLLAQVMEAGGVGAVKKGGGHELKKKVMRILSSTTPDSHKGNQQ